MLTAIEALIQRDVNRRGLRTRPDANLVTGTAGDFGRACHALAALPTPRVVVVTGFTIPDADPPVSETDGPLGAVFLARALVPAGVHVAVAADGTALPAITAGLEACGLAGVVPVAAVPDIPDAYGRPMRDTARELRPRMLAELFAAVGPANCLLALERVGPSHTPESLAHADTPFAERDQFLTEVRHSGMGRCYSMRGRDVTPFTRPAHLLFETVPGMQVGGLLTVGVGDGGNEIGMGNVRWGVVRRNVPNGGQVACRTRVDHLVVAGVSNWGAYGLAAGVRHLKAAGDAGDLYDASVERDILAAMVAAGPLVDGVTGRRELTVDGLAWDRYSAILADLAALEGGSS